MLIIGSHVSFGGMQLLAATEEAINYKANTFMFYTGAPTNTLRVPIDISLTKKAQELMLNNGIDINNVEIIDISQYNSITLENYAIGSYSSVYVCVGLL